jgi:hypothetical protein
MLAQESQLMAYGRCGFARNQAENGSDLVADGIILGQEGNARVALSTGHKFGVKLAKVPDIVAIQDSIVLGGEAKLLNIRSAERVGILHGQNINLPGT